MRPTPPRAVAVLGTTVLLVVTLFAGGCSHKQLLMPTPTIYTRPELNPFADVPPALQNNRVSVLYVTDREPEPAKNPPDPRGVAYGWKRSRSAAFGECVVQIGPNDLSWPDLVQASRTAHRAKELPIEVTSTRELGRFLPTPPHLILSDAQLAATRGAVEEMIDEQRRAEDRFRQELSSRLARSPDKEVVLYVHGFNTTLDGSAFTAAELWHFLGRRGVPVAYSWPAGVGTFRAYEYTNDSSLFTTYHLKQTLRLIASCPDVQRVNIVAHSRGTDVIATAVRELDLEIRGAAETRKVLKLDKAVLAAADINIDVFIQRLATERTARACNSVLMYACRKDKALGLSAWLVGGGMRVGDLQPTIFRPDELERLRESRRIQIVDAKVTERGAFGHNYFHANPAVSSDMILYLRYGLAAGGENGRPLTRLPSGFWQITDPYPSTDSWVTAIQQQSPSAGTAAAKSDPAGAAK